MVRRLVLALALVCGVLSVDSSVASAAEPTYFLPFPDGMAYSVTQGPGGSTSHTNTSNRYAYDFGLALGTPVAAAASGVVRAVGDTGDGYGKKIVIEHVTSVCTLYAHLQDYSTGINVGQRIARGTMIGTSGNTGNVTGPHLHFSKTNCAYVSYPIAFAEGATLATGSTYRSKNVPGSYGGTWYMRNYLSAGSTNYSFGYGRRGDTPVAGNWDGVGGDTQGVFRDGTWYLRNYLSAGGSNYQFGYGRLGDYPVAGNWDGVGGDTVGVFRDGTWYLRNYNSAGSTNYTFGYGRAGDVPVVGDWNNDGKDTVGVFRNGTWYLRNSNSAGATSYTFGYGRTGDVPVVGDWNNDGKDTIGVYRNGTVYFRNSNSAGASSGSFNYGGRGDLPVAGDWDNYLTDTVGLLR
jgi:hypothetical protein